MPAPKRCPDLPEMDRRATGIRHLHLPYTFQPFLTEEAWLKRAGDLRRQIQVSAGLWPPVEKSPLKARIFGKVSKGDYSIEKVFFESYPGFYVTGNLYRPLGKKGPFPGILTPHGHWAYGRLENQSLASMPGLSINLARQGHVVFAYDMLAYNDSRQVKDHRRPLDRSFSLWGIGWLGIQLWNSIRSVDFLQSLPDVDPNRLGCTGASGGGTQTFLLTAVDDRIKVSAPVNMISHYMQGGCICENQANLRLDTNNMEIAALMAPRPLLMVSASGDWTRETPGWNSRRSRASIASWAPATRCRPCRPWPSTTSTGRAGRPSMPGSAAGCWGRPTPASSPRSAFAWGVPRRCWSSSVESFPPPRSPRRRCWPL